MMVRKVMDGPSHLYLSLFEGRHLTHAVKFEVGYAYGVNYRVSSEGFQGQRKGQIEGVTTENSLATHTHPF